MAEHEGGWDYEVTAILAGVRHLLVVSAGSRDGAVRAAKEFIERRDGTAEGWRFPSRKVRPMVRA